jgi:hypothetical protein
VEWFDHTDSKYDEGERYIGFIPYTEANDNGDFDMQFFVVAGDGADITDYTTGCAEYTITYYGFRGGYSTSTSSDGIIVLPVNSLHTVPDCGDVVTDHTNLGREFLNVWMTQPHGGHTFKPGDTFILTQDTTLYAQWKMETTSDVTTLPTDIEDLAGTDVYVYGGKTLNIQPGTTTINSLTLKGGIQSDGKYQMPNVWCCRTCFKGIYGAFVRKAWKSSTLIVLHPFPYCWNKYRHPQMLQLYRKVRSVLDPVFLIPLTLYTFHYYS